METTRSRGEGQTHEWVLWSTAAVVATGVQFAGAFSLTMYGNPEGTPPALLHALEHFRVLHERVVLLRVDTEEVPHIPRSARAQVDQIEEGFYSPPRSGRAAMLFLGLVFSASNCDQTRSMSAGDT